MELKIKRTHKWQPLGRRDDGDERVKEYACHRGIFILPFSSCHRH